MKHFLTLALSLMIISGMYAQSLDDTIKLKETEINLVYKPSEKTPVTEKTIKKDEIQSKSIGQEIPVFLKTTPSVTSYSDGGHSSGYTYMRMRGVDQTRINFTLNGCPMNEPEDQGFYSSNFPDFLANLNSVQIQRGVGTTSYGNSSYVGSINLETANLQQEKGSNLTFFGGSFNSYKVASETKTGLLPNNWAFYGRFSVTGTDGYRYHSGSKGGSMFISAGKFSKNYMVKFNGFTGYSNNAMAWLGSPDSEIKIDPKYNANSSEEEDMFFQTFIQAQLIKNVSKKSIITTSAFYNRLCGNWDLLIAPEYMLNFQLWSNFGGAIVNYKYTSDKTRINLGVNGNYYERYHACGVYPNVKEFLYKNKGEKSSASAYAKIERDFNGLTFFADIEQKLISFIYHKDNIDSLSSGMSPIFWSFLNPKTGVSYKTKNSKIYFSVGNTKREPTRTDMFGGCDNLSYIMGTATTNFFDVHYESVVD